MGLGRFFVVSRIFAVLSRRQKQICEGNFTRDCLPPEKPFLQVNKNSWGAFSTCQLLETPRGKRWKFERAREGWSSTVLHWSEEGFFFGRDKEGRKRDMEKYGVEFPKHEWSHRLSLRGSRRSHQ
ncbi:hypothetical protein K0M31_008244, partial [Melipona bicolor]